mgnify:FL=1
MPIIKKCLTCRSEFKTKPSILKRGQGKYCSQKCKRHSQETKNKIGEHWKKEKNPRWNCGKTINSQGYLLVKAPSHPFAENRGYVREHRIVMEKHIGRFLDPSEDIHHINGIKIDNRIENLQIISRKDHTSLHKLRCTQ